MLQLYCHRSSARHARGRRKDFFQGGGSSRSFQGGKSGKISFYQLQTKSKTFFLPDGNENIKFQYPGGGQVPPCPLPDAHGHERGSHTVQRYYHPALLLSILLLPSIAL